ncbi:hypothetical protein TWF569_009205 [Orbilia oligospora]|uniref:Uncharacterized protein n=1 Tax=Orbilia oligospora TaxID=2813651 RepID=A0A7C8MY95_ORBOL|nr:hypothetical protein TWF103_004032 [Orbilia oligospora]KAF3085121.1 hypothetical protein TWF706_000565 [Orbilia oligospora]KAF3085681.1 hypothetical protein TWF102_011310 [Orbilia oligospora]KAF3127162.1 hypothetical protein TWF594_000757 [Orbilia oligospora]KAF3137507.1 hypothetical protein TWF569_009205 [Orbilia oligospora]
MLCCTELGVELGYISIYVFTPNVQFKSVTLFGPNPGNDWGPVQSLGIHSIVRRSEKERRGYKDISIGKNLVDSFEHLGGSVILTANLVFGLDFPSGAGDVDVIIVDEP